MNKLEYSQNALADINRLILLLIENDIPAALNTFDVIDEAIQVLKRHPDIGCVTNKTGKRELVISRGRTGYIAVYEFDKLTNIIVILAVKHQRENEFN
jgi:plasmid stabilization system protein ParE